MVPALKMYDPIILHLASPADVDNDLDVLERADFIFAQLTSEKFMPDHLATKGLRAAFPGKVIAWPNIFYAGQQPFLRYLTHPEGGRMLGPFEAMHDLRLYRSWLHTGKVEPEAVLHADPLLVAETARVSLATLRGRDALADVAVADLIDQDPSAVPTFFTFNHPRQVLLAQVARRLLEKAGLGCDWPPAPPRGEPLGRYRVPGIDNVEQMKGDPWPADGTRQARIYGLPELSVAFQGVYEADPRFRDPARIRFTPTIGWEQDFLDAC
jgi:hypothetical protein